LSLARERVWVGHDARSFGSQIVGELCLEQRFLDAVVGTGEFAFAEARGSVNQERVEFLVFRADIRAGALHQ
jgi:hypothetical protein